MKTMLALVMFLSGCSFILQEITNIRAQQELANDELACRYIVSAAMVLLGAV